MTKHLTSFQSLFLSNFPLQIILIGWCTQELWQGPFLLHHSDQTVKSYQLLPAVILHIKCIRGASFELFWLGNFVLWNQTCWRCFNFGFLFLQALAFGCCHCFFWNAGTNATIWWTSVSNLCLSRCLQATSIDPSGYQRLIMSLLQRARMSVLQETNRSQKKEIMHIKAKKKDKR